MIQLSCCDWVKVPPEAIFIRPKCGSKGGERCVFGCPGGLAFLVVGGVGKGDGRGFREFDMEARALVEVFDHAATFSMSGWEVFSSRVEVGGSVD